MKKSIAIFLFVCLIVPLSGTYLYFSFKKMMIKKEVNNIILNKLNGDELVVLRFSEAEAAALIDWKGKCEFEYNGHMYDVVDHRQDGTGLVMTCYRDHKETKLNAEKQKFVAKALNQDPVQKSQNNYLKNFFNTIFQNDNFTWTPGNNVYSAIHYSLLTFHYSLTERDPISPPPKSA